MMCGIPYPALIGRKAQYPLVPAKEQNPSPPPDFPNFSHLVSSHLLTLPLIVFNHHFLSMLVLDHQSVVLDRHFSPTSHVA